MAERYIQLKTLSTDDQQLDRVQSLAASSFLQLQRENLILNGVFKTVTIGTLPQAVEHGLGKPLTGWLVVDRNADANVWRTAGARPEDQLILQASATVTVTLYFF